MEPTSVQLLHPYWRNKVLAQAEQAEAERRANEPSPRRRLRQAHADRAVTRAENDRLLAALERAQSYLNEVTARHVALAGEVEREEAASAEALIAELTEGTAGRSATRPAGEHRVALAQAEADESVAQRAQDTLAGQLDAAKRDLARTVRAVHEAAALLLLEVARREAEMVLAEADALDRRRAALDALGMQVTDLQRQLGINPGTVRWPPVIQTALQPELRDKPVLPSRFAGSAPQALQHWSAVGKALIVDAEAYPELDINGGEDGDGG